MAGVFLGRESELGRVLDMMHAQRVALMTATSGAGKTSLVQAALLPRLREMRLAELEHDPEEYPDALFPILLNQWLGRAGKGKAIDFAQLVALEMHRYLRKSLRWYQGRSDQRALSEAERQGQAAETAAMEKAAAAIGEYAVANSFGALEQFDNDVVLTWRDSGGSLDTDNREDVTRRLLAVLDMAVESLGEIVVIFDQFEEVLLDRSLHQQALDAIESVYLLRDGDVRQFISMREDNSNLIGDLDRKGILESRRKMLILPLSVGTTTRVIEEASRAAGFEWEETPVDQSGAILDLLVGAFSGELDQGLSHDEVNLVGLQVVLDGMFRAMGPKARLIGRKSLDDYCSRLVPTELGKPRTLAWWLAEGLRSEAPRQWIVECLGKPTVDGRKDDGERLAYEPQVQPMAARMSELLVTPGGNKRSMTSTELETRAYDRVEKQDFAGAAMELEWDVDRFAAVQHATCAETLARLVDGNVLKKQGAGSQADEAFELVHDQFGKPFQAWAADLTRTPEFDLSSLNAIDYRVFPWSGALLPHDDDGVIPNAVWRSCWLSRVDLSDLTFRDCDFRRTRFERCTFRNVRFEGSNAEQAYFNQCEFENVAFVDTILEDASFRGCTEIREAEFAGCNLDSVDFGQATEMHAVSFSDCEMRSMVVRERTVMEHVTIGAGKGVSFSEFRGVTFRDCVFGRASTRGLRLEMHNARLRDCAFEGNVIFQNCVLDAVTIVGEKTETSLDGVLHFIGCSMVGLRLDKLDVRSQTFHIEDCDCRGAAFSRLDARQDEAAETDVRFERVSLIGASATGCQLEDIDFIGDISGSTDISTFTIAGSKDDPSTVARLTFTNLDAENISIERCEILGDVTFTRCKLSGLTFKGCDRTRAVRGRVRFQDGCDLAAAEISSLDFAADFPLEMEDCSARGLLLVDVGLVGRVDKQAGSFIRTELTGSLLEGCRLEHVLVSGHSAADYDARGAWQFRTPAMTFVVRPLKARSSQIGSGGGVIHTPSVLRDVTFERVDLSGFRMYECDIVGGILFRNCCLNGAVLGARDMDLDARRAVAGDLTFESCDMEALRLVSLDFQGTTLRIGGHSRCKGATFDDVGFSTLAKSQGRLIIDDSDVAGSTFVDCTLPHARIAGTSEERARGLMLAFKRDRRATAELGDLLIENYALDGASIENVVLTGPVVLRKCSLTRTKYCDIICDAGGSLDLRDSSLRLIEIDDVLLAGSSSLLITEEQRQAITGCPHT